MHNQDQFLNVIDRDEAERRFRAALTLRPSGSELIPVREALGRVLSERVLAAVDVPAFDRSNFDGYAVQAADTFGVSERSPGRILLLPQTLEAGAAADFRIDRGQAAAIATGGMLPGGADAVLMIEHAEELDGSIIVRRAVTPGTGISFAGTDIACGETVLSAGTPLTSRETGVLAALGEIQVAVWKKPKSR
jgi:putative molybdopterin biosynthesis protein